MWNTTSNVQRSNAPTVLVIAGAFHPEPGGPSTYLYHLLPELIRCGHRVSVICYGDDVEGHEYPYPVTRISRRQPIPARLARFTAEILCQGREADLLFVSGYGLPAAVANVYLHKPVLLKVVGDFAWEYAIRHDLIPPTEDIDVFQRQRYAFPVECVKWVRSFYSRRAGIVIPPSQYLAQMIAGWGVPREKIIVIPNAIHPTPYAPASCRTEARQRAGVSGRVILAVARLNPWKGIDKLIQILPGLATRIPDVNLIVVGDGPERARLEGLADRLGVSDRVTFRGRVPREEVGTYFQAADVFVLYSGYEGLPHVVLEAMTFGVPVVVSDKGGNREVVEDGVTGLVVPLDGTGPLEAAVGQILSDAALAARLSAAARERLASFNWERMVARTLDVLENVK